MLLPRKWALSLGLLAAAPSLVLAGPLDVLKPRSEQSAATATESGKPTKNQDVANSVASALRKADLVHRNVKIEVKGGVASISGEIKDASQRALVTQIVSQVPGIQKVDNKLVPMEQAAAPATENRVMQASAEQLADPGAQRVAQAFAEAAQAQSRTVQPVNFAPAASNQEVAQQIAESLTAAGLSGYDIEVRFKDGMVSLIGSVEDQEQVARAYQAASSVPGVNQVINKLNAARGGNIPAYAAGPQGQPHPGFAPQGYAPQGYAPQGYAPQGYAPQGYAPQGMAPQGYGPQGMAPQGYGIQQAQGMGMAPGMGPGMAPAPMGAPQFGNVQPAGHMIHNQPNVPEYAWPSYAPYDNSAAITYPTQYDASAFPYIGPYYPYPQVPMSWRESKLVWDDGYWNLQFNSRTDKWWWFMFPKNWH